MAEQRHSEARTHSSTDERRILKRRGILAAAGAVVAGIVAKQTAQPVAAGGTEGTALILGDTNSATTDTSLIRSPASPSDFPQYGLIVSNASGYTGVRGVARNLGVFGYAFGTGSVGMYGYNTNPSGTGVTGFGPEVGVAGNGSDPQIPGSNGTGVYGVSNGGNGVIGSSMGANGVLGTTSAASQGGVVGLGTVAGAVGVSGGASVAGAFAAYFTGSVVVNGNFVATGGTKSAAVPLNGGHRLVYCMESPESWFEDFGEAKLVNGKAEVKLDAEFAGIVHIDAYHVFLTEYGASSHLYVASRTASGFTVASDKAGASASFGYRIVARRKDIVGERLAKFEMPKIHHPDPDKLPKPELPKQPEPSRKP